MATLDDARAALRGAETALATVKHSSGGAPDSPELLQTALDLCDQAGAAIEEVMARRRAAVRAAARARVGRMEEQRG